MGRTKAATNGKELGKPKYGRGQHPNSKKNLEAMMAKPGDVKNPNGRPMGSPDRATVIRALMDTEINVQDPTKPKGMTMKVSLYSAAALGQFRAAMNGSTQAWKEIQDSLHGKLPDKFEGTVGIQKIEVEWLDGDSSIIRHDGDEISDSIN